MANEIKNTLYIILLAILLFTVRSQNVPQLTDEEILAYLEEGHTEDELDVYLRDNMNRMDMDKWYPIFKNYTVAVEITDVFDGDEKMVVKFLEGNNTREDIILFIRTHNELINEDTAKWNPLIQDALKRADMLRDDDGDNGDSNGHKNDNVTKNPQDDGVVMLTDEEIYSFLEGYPNDEEIDFYLRRNLERMDVKKWYPIFQAAIEQAKERQAGLVDPLPEAEIKRFLAEEHSPDEIQVYLRSNLYRMDIKRWHPLFEKATELAEQREKETYMFTTEQLVSILEQLDSYNDIMVFYRAQWKRIPTDILPLVHQALDDAEPPDTNNGRITTKVPIESGEDNSEEEERKRQLKAEMDSWREEWERRIASGDISTGGDYTRPGSEEKTGDEVEDARREKAEALANQIQEYNKVMEAKLRGEDVGMHEDIKKMYEEVESRALDLFSSDPDPEQIIKFMTENRHTMTDQTREALSVMAGNIVWEEQRKHLQQTQQDLREQELLELGDAARLEQWKHQQQWQEAWLQKNEEALQEAKRRQLEGTDWQEEQIRLAEEIIEERRQAAQKYLNDLREAKARQEWAEEMRKKFD